MSIRTSNIPRGQHPTETLSYPYNGKVRAVLGPMFSAKCFGMDTRLLDGTGAVIKVTDITPGTMLMTTNGPSPVLDVYDVETGTVTITELNGSSHVVSVEHLVPVVTADGPLRLVPAGELISYGDRPPRVSSVSMVTRDGARVGFTAVPSERRLTRGIVMGGNYQLLVLANGTLTHNSSALTEELERQRIARMKIVLVRPAIDTRYDEYAVAGGIVLHSGKEYAKCPILRAKHLADLDLEFIMRFDVVGVDEIGMFDDVLMCVEWANLGKRVVVCGIVGDYKLDNFRNVHMLLPHCDAIIHQSAVCTGCGKRAAFTKRLTDETDSLVVGGSDKYTSLCRKCYYTIGKNELMIA